MEDIYLIGIGRYTEVIIELATACGYEVKGLYHYNSDRTGEFVDGIEVLGSTVELLEGLNDLTGLNFALTMGDNTMRVKLANDIRRSGGRTPSLVHPKADISPSSCIGQGCLIHIGAILWTKSNIGNDCILSPSAHISHHATIRDGCFVTSFSIVGAYSVLGECVFMGLNSIVLPNLNIYKKSLIGAKANVIKSVFSTCILVGNPARIIKKRKK